MDIHFDELVQDMVIALLDIIVILLVEDNPILAVALVALIKSVTKDHLIRILFILMIIAIGTTKEI